MIRNVESGEQVVPRCRLLRRWFEHATGLMFRKRLVDEGLVFVFPRAARWDLTNVFVFQSIDALWLDANQRVLQVRTIPPFRFVERGVAGARFVIELPAGCARATGTRVGHRVVWE